MRIGVSSYSFSRLVNEGKLTQTGVVGKAKEMGFDAIEFSTLKLDEGEKLPDLAKRLKDLCDSGGLPIESYTIGADFLNGSNGDLRAEIERVKEEVKIAKILGVKKMRHDATRGYPAEFRGAKGFDDALPTLVKGCRAVTEFAADLGIQTMVENHGYFCQDARRVEKLVNAVNHGNFGLLIDMGNFLCADNDPAEAFGLLLPYAFHCHAKDFHVKPGTWPNPGRGWFQSRAGNWLRGSIIGHGDVPVTTCLRLMKKAEYKGVLSIEFEGMEEPLNGIAAGLENLRRFVKEMESA